MKPQFKDVEHLLRLAALFVAGLLMFAVVRAQLVPDDFGKEGHYRFGAVAEARNRPISYAGQTACGECHGDVVETRQAAGHTSVACESCHGPLATHAGDPEKQSPVLPDAGRLCARCHAANTGKPSWYRTVDVKEHAGDEGCPSCHKPHDPRVQ